MAEDNNKPTLGEIPKNIRIKTPAELAAEGAKREAGPLIGGEDSTWVGSFLGNVVGGAASVVASPFKAMDRALAAAAGAEYREDVGSPLTRLGRGIEDVAGKVAAGDPERAEDFSSALAQGLGSTAGFLVPGALLGTGARGAAGIAGLGAAATGVEQAEDYEATIREQGGTIDPTKQGQALFAGMLPGTIEAIPLIKALSRLDNIDKGGLSAAIKNTAKGTVEEALQEGIQSTAQNLIASNLIKYDPDRDMFFDTPEAAAVGGGVGFIINSVMSAVGLRQRGKYHEAALKAMDDTRKQTLETEETQSKVNPVTGQPLENNDIAKANKLIQRYERMAATDPTNEKAYNRRVEEIKQELRKKFFTKDDKNEYTSSAIERQEATDVLTRIEAQEVEQIDAVPAPFEGDVDAPPVREAEPFPARMGKEYRVKEITNQKEIDKFNREYAKLRPEEITITAPTETFPTAEGISVEEVEPTIEEINLDTTPAPQERTFFEDRPANFALAEQLQRITEQRKRRNETDAAFEARKQAEIEEAYRQRELQLAEQEVPFEAQEETLRPTTVEPAVTPTTEQAQEPIPATEREAGVVPEGGIVTKSGAGYKSEAVARANMKRQGIQGRVVEYAPDQFAIIPEAAVDEAPTVETTPATPAATTITPEEANALDLARGPLVRQPTTPEQIIENRATSALDQDLRAAQNTAEGLIADFSQFENSLKDTEFNRIAKEYDTALQNRDLVGTARAIAAMRRRIAERAQEEPDEVDTTDEVQDQTDDFAPRNIEDATTEFTDELDVTTEAEPEPQQPRRPVFAHHNEQAWKRFNWALNEWEKGGRRGLPSFNILSDYYPFESWEKIPTEKNAFVEAWRKKVVRDFGPEAVAEPETTVEATTLSPVETDVRSVNPDTGTPEGVKPGTAADLWTGTPDQWRDRIAFVQGDKYRNTINNMTVEEIQEYRDLGRKGRTNYLNKLQARRLEPLYQALEKTTVPKLKEILKTLDIPGRSKLTNKRLIIDGIKWEMNERHEAFLTGYLRLDPETLGTTGPETVVDDNAGYTPAGTDLSSGTIEEVRNSPIEKPEQIPLDDVVYDEVISIGNRMQESRSPERFAQEIEEKFGSVQQFMALWNGIQKNQIVRANPNQTEVIATPAGTVESQEAVDARPAEVPVTPTVAVSNRVEEVDLTLDRLDVEINALQDELDSGYAENPSEIKKQIATLKRRQKENEAKQMELRRQKDIITEDELRDIIARDHEVDVFEDNGYFDDGMASVEDNVVTFRSKEEIKNLERFKERRGKVLNLLNTILESHDSEIAEEFDTDSEIMIRDIRINAADLIKFMENNPEVIPDLDFYLTVPREVEPNSFVLQQYKGQEVEWDAIGVDTVRLTGRFVYRIGRWRAEVEDHTGWWVNPSKLGLTQEQLQGMYDWRNRSPSADLDPGKIEVKELEVEEEVTVTRPAPTPKAVYLAERVVSKFISQMDPAFREQVDIYVVSKPEDIKDPSMREEYERRFSNVIVNGLYYPGNANRKDTVLIFARDGRTRDEIEWTVFHEVIGHFGFKRMFGHQWNNFLDIALKNPLLASKAFALGRRWTGLGEELFKTKGLSSDDLIEVTNSVTYTAAPNAAFKDRFASIRNGKKYTVSRAALRKLLDEYIAEIAGNLSNKTFRDNSREEIGLLNRVKVWIRHLFRKAGISNPKVVTDGDILAMVGESYARVMGAGIPVSEGQIMDLTWNKVEPFARRNGLNFPMENFIQEYGKSTAESIKTYSEQRIKPQVAHVVNPGTKDAQIIPSADLLEAQAQVEAAIDESVNLGHIVSREEGKRILQSIQNREGRLDNSRHQRFVERIADRVRRTTVGKIMSSNGHLPYVRVLNAIENWAKGGIEIGQVKARRFARKTKDLNDIQKKAIYDYFKTKNADVSNLPVSEEIKKLAKENKEYIEKLGESLVVMGALKRETWEADRGSYLTVRYFHYLEGYYAAGGKRLSFQNYLKKQKGLSKEEKAALGEIKDPSFLVPETVATIARDVALGGLFKNIITMDEVGKLGWTLGERQFTEVDGKKMKLSDIEKKIESLTFLRDAKEDLGPLYKDEQDQKAIEAQLAIYQEARTVAKANLRNEVVEVLGERGITDITEDMINQVIDREYVQVNDKRYGALYKKYIRKELYDEIVDSGQFFDKDHADFFGKAFGAGGYSDRANQAWKSMKVTLNPPSWFRNGVGNLVLMDIGTSTSIHKLIKYMVDEVNAWISGKPSKYFQMAHENGLWATTYSAAELNLMSQQFQDAFKGHVTINTERNLFKKAYWMFDEKIKMIFERGTEIYGGMEGFFKTVALRDYIQRWETQNGTKLEDADPNTREAVIREAVEAANNNIFDYSKVPGWMRSVRRMPFVGAPFLTYTFKALPYVMESFARRPHKFIKYAALPYALAQAFMLTQDLDDEDYDEIMRMMPKWQQEKSSIYLLPWKDANGNFQTMDFGYYFPWAPFHNLSLMAQKTFDVRNPVMSTGNVALRFGTDLGFLGGPLPQMISAAVTNIDPFSGREIIRTAGTTQDKQNDFMRYMIDMWTPTFLTSKGVLGRTLDNLGIEPTAFNTGQQLNVLGKDKETWVQSSLRGVGVSARPLDPQLELRNKVKTYQNDKRKLEQARSAIIKDRNLSSETKASKIREMNEQIKLLNEKHRKEIYGE